MNEPDLVRLKTFVLVVEQGSFSAAAETLGLSQPAVSLQMRQLERDLGVRLIERVGRRAQPTAAGRQLLVHARRIQEEVRNALEAIAPHRSHAAGHLRIGTGATACIYLLPPVLGNIRRRMPGLEITVRTGDTGDMLRLLEANALDAAIVTLPAAGRSLEFEVVYEDELVAVFPASETIPETAITPAFLATRQLMLYEGSGNTRKLIDQWFERSGQHPKPVMELATDHPHFAAGIGWRPLSPPLRRDLGLALRRDKHLTRGLRELIAALRPKSR